MLQNRHRWLEMVMDAPEHWQADRLDVQPSEPFDMSCSTQEAIRFMAQQQTEAIKCYQRDTSVSKYPSTALRCGSSTNAGHEASHRTGRVGVEPPAVLHVCVTRILFTIVSQARAMGHRKRKQLYSSQTLLQECLHDCCILRRIICAGGIN